MNTDTNDLARSYDAIVIGGGSAGLSAALTLGRALRRVLVIDSGEPRNRFASHMHGVLGHEGRDPADLIRMGRAECEQYDVTFHTGSVDRVTDPADVPDHLTVTLTDGTDLSARALVVATGISDDLPRIPGLAPRWGIDVLHCPYCHGWEVRGQRLAVLATGPLSLHQIEIVRQWSDDLVFLSAAAGPLPEETQRRLTSRGIRIEDTPVAEVLTGHGAEGERLVGVLLDDGRRIDLDAIFTAPTARPHDTFLAAMNLERADTPMGNFITVDASGRTSHPRIWAAGNVINPGANVAISVGGGSLAGAMANMALIADEFDAATLALASPN